MGSCPVAVQPSRVLNMKATTKTRAGATCSGDEPGVLIYSDDEGDLRVKPVESHSVLLLSVDTALGEAHAALWVDGSERDLGAGGLGHVSVLVPSGSDARLTWSGAALTVTQVIVPERHMLVARRQVSSVRPSEIGCEVRTGDSSLASLAAAMREAANGRSGWTRGVCLEHLSLALCATLMACMQRERDQREEVAHPLVAQAVALMQARMAEPLSLEDLATTVGASRWYLGRLMKRELGHSPHAFLLRLRVQRAMVMLRNPDLSIAQVAGDVGFCDQSHLNRHFKAVAGCTPAVYRRKLRVCDSEMVRRTG